MDQNILDVNQPQHVVEGVAINRKARMPLLDQQLNEAIHPDADACGYDVGAGHHDVVGGAAAQLQDIEKQKPFLCRNRLLGFALALLDELFDRFAQARLPAASQQPMQPIPEAAKMRTSILSFS